ncbi:hypothetical protein KPNJ1_01265 [Klebsiella pneumoniae 30660/NJST258_1]|uniref:Uncharacterized protein n=1 Tax=Klebsiella pneumoniae 30684/NJST258_2 TaxID=1420013 RepID=W8VEV6_KLEPN|nr:hypothetical protein KPNJ2_01291 [Klebsiella pneumoniae 30684/NJST258_2]AHM83671.1 hypothetical protein KPNJ1_01265 [Klebsiella pneumoniae 30660/NJST258_1]
MHSYFIPGHTFNILFIIVFLPSSYALIVEY